MTKKEYIESFDYFIENKFLLEKKYKKLSFISWKENLSVTEWFSLIAEFCIAGERIEELRKLRCEYDK
jgi:hypothetical protein